MSTWRGCVCRSKGLEAAEGKREKRLEGRREEEEKEEERKAEGETVG